MRVLLVSQEFPPETRWGGIGTYAGILAPALARAGADVSVLSVVRGQARSDQAVDGVRVHRRPVTALPGLGRITGLPEAAKRVQLARAVGSAVADLELATGPFDVIECPDWNAEGLTLSHRPVITRLHSMAAQLFPYLGRVGIDERLAIALEARAVRRATLVVGTRAQTAAARSLIGIAPQRLRTLTLPVMPVEPDLDYERAEPGRIVFVGRFEQRKAPEVLIDALPLVRAAVSNARLVLVGRDCARPEHPSAITWLRARAEVLGVGDALEIIDGWAGPDIVREQLLRGSVFAAPSRWESFSYVAAEAAALARPVVATNVPGFADVVSDGETGRLAADRDVEGWAGALVEILEDRARGQQLGRSGAHRMATVCNPDRVASETLTIYGEAIAAFPTRALVEVGT